MAICISCVAVHKEKGHYCYAAPDETKDEEFYCDSNEF